MWIRISDLAEGLSALTVNFTESFHHVTSIKSEEQVINGLINNSLLTLISTRIAFKSFSVKGSILYVNCLKVE